MNISKVYVSHSQQGNYRGIVTYKTCDGLLHIWHSRKWRDNLSEAYKDAIKKSQELELMPETEWGLGGWR